MFTNRENHRGKTPQGEFKVTTPENPLLSKQAITSKAIPVPYANLQLNPYPNTQLDLQCSDNLSFQCTALCTWLSNRCTDPNLRLTHQLEKDIGCKVLQFIHTMKIKKLIGYKTLRHTNATASSRERWIRANCLWLQFEWIITLHQVASSCVTLNGP